MSTKKITKIFNNGEEYELGGAEYSAGSGISISSGNEISNSGVLSVNGQTGEVSVSSMLEYTQSEYDDLPSSKETDGVWRMIYE